jgi:hypothetical protein
MGQWSALVVRSDTGPKPTLLLPQRGIGFQASFGFTFAPLRTALLPSTPATDPDTDNDAAQLNPLNLLHPLNSVFPSSLRRRCFNVFQVDAALLQSS